MTAVTKAPLPVEYMGKRKKGIRKRRASAATHSTKLCHTPEKKKEKMFCRSTSGQKAKAQLELILHASWTTSEQIAPPRPLPNEAFLHLHPHVIRVLCCGTAVATVELSKAPNPVVASIMSAQTEDSFTSSRGGGTTGGVLTRPRHQGFPPSMKNSWKE